MKARSEAFFKEAKKNLKQANDEMFKPEEDLLGYSVCKNAQFAIKHYLIGFLLSHEVELGTNETITSLYEKCKQIDNSFGKIELHSVTCRNSAVDSRYCTKLDTISACFDTADSIDTLLRKKNLI